MIFVTDDYRFMDDTTLIAEWEIAVNTPTITGPATDATDSSIFTGSPFTNEGRHDMSDWILVESDAPEAEIWSSKNDDENLTTCPSLVGVLEVSKSYILKLRYHEANNNVWSEYGSFSFTTAAVFNRVDVPSLVVEGGDQVFERPTLTAGAFSSTTDDTHESTDWEVVKALGGQIVWSSHNDTVNKTSIKLPSGVLEISTSYKARARYKGTALGYSGWAEASFRTVDNFIAVVTPTITGNTTEVNISDTYTSSKFAMNIGEGSHDKTDWVLVKAAEPETEIWHSKNNTKNLTNCPNFSSVLEVSTNYTLKVRYHDKTNDLWSSWGELSFATATKFSGVPVPGGSIGEGDSSNTSVDDVFEVGPFQEFEDPNAYLAAVDWELYKDSEKVWSWLNAPGCPRLYTFKGYRLLPATDYVLKFRFKSSLENWSEWGEYAFRTAPELSYPTIKFKMKGTINLGQICKWWDTSELHVYKNGELDVNMTSNPTQEHTLSSNGDIIEIVNFKNKDNFPFISFANNANLISVEAPLPYLRNFSNGAGVTDFGGDTGDNTGIYQDDNQTKYGMFAYTTALTSVADYLFKHNPQVLNLGGMGGAGYGGDGGGGDGYYGAAGGDGAGGYTGSGCFFRTALTTIPDHLLAGLSSVTNMGGYGGGGGGAGAGSGERGRDGYSGYGCFSQTNLTTIPSALFSDMVSLKNLGGYGGGGGGNGFKTGGNGGNGYGCFAESKLTSIPDKLFSGLRSLTNLGGYGGGGGAGGSNGIGGDGYGCFYNCPLTSISATIFSGLTSINIHGFGGYYINDTQNGGKGYGCFYGSKITSIPEKLFAELASVSLPGYYEGGYIGKASGGVGGGAGGGAGYYGGGGGGGNGFGMNGDDGKDGEKGSGGEGGEGHISGTYYSGGEGGSYVSTMKNRSETSYGPFADITTLTSAPIDLLKNCTALRFVCGFFRGCTALTTTLRFGGTSISEVGYFAYGCRSKSTVYAPAGSTTAITFKSDSTANVNVIEE